MAAFFTATIYQPFYNGLIFLIGTFPFFDAGIIVIIFTIIVKLILLPLSLKASKAQLEMKSHEKNLNELKERYKHSKEELNKKTIEYYKEKGINPFTGIFVILIQLPILIGFYRVFIKSGLPKIDTTLLYSFLAGLASIVPNMMFLGLINISQKSLTLAIIAGITTYFQFSFASSQPVSGAKGTQGDIAKAMSVQMKYFLPVFMVYVAYITSGAVSLYLITSNLFAIGQEIYIRKKYHKSIVVIDL